MSARSVSVSESSTLATCREGPCQRLPVGSAASADRNRKKVLESLGIVSLIGKIHF